MKLAFLLAILLHGQTDSTPSADLVHSAQAARARAQQTLTAGRNARLKARAKMSQALQVAEAKLAAVRSRLQEAQTRLTGLKTRAQDRERAAARVSRAEAELRRLLGQVAQLAPEARARDPEILVADVQRGLDERLDRLEHDTHVHVSTGAEALDRNGELRSGVTIIRLGTVLALARGEDSSTLGFVNADLEPPQVVGPVLPPSAQAALLKAEPGAKGSLPLDLDGALASQSAEAPAPDDDGGLAAGGFFVWPILAVGLLALIIVVERLHHFWRRPVRPERIEAVRAALAAGSPERARAAVDPTATDLDRVLKTGIDSVDAPRTTREQALETALLREEPALERGMRLLGAVAALAPLLGLLGTVTGMIATFDVIATFGTGNPRLLSGGISVALITTQLGLVVAVPTLLAHAALSRMVAQRQGLLERARTELLTLGDEA